MLDADWLSVVGAKSDKYRPEKYEDTRRVLTIQPKQRRELVAIWRTHLHNLTTVESAQTCRAIQGKTLLNMHTGRAYLSWIYFRAYFAEHIESNIVQFRSLPGASVNSLLYLVDNGGHYKSE